jgi:hypothetical protein
LVAATLSDSTSGFFQLSASGQLAIAQLQRLFWSDLLCVAGIHLLFALAELAVTQQIAPDFRKMVLFELNTRSVLLMRRTAQGYPG